VSHDLHVLRTHRPLHRANPTQPQSTDLRMLQTDAQQLAEDDRAMHEQEPSTVCRLRRTRYQGLREMARQLLEARRGHADKTERNVNRPNQGRRRVPPGKLPMVHQERASGEPQEAPQEERREHFNPCLLNSFAIQCVMGNVSANARRSASSPASSHRRHCDSGETRARWPKNLPRRKRSDCLRVRPGLLSSSPRGNH
jgi:hypothetical protein